MDLESDPSALPTHQKRASRVTGELYTISYLIFFSMIGTLARLGLQSLTAYPEAPVKTGVLWANFGGSLIIGFLVEDRKLFGNQSQFTTSRKGKSRKDHVGNSASDSGQQECGNGVTAETHLSLKKSIPLYIGLVTGFCGSFTSFSAFIRDAFLALSNSLPEDPRSMRVPASPVSRNAGYGVLAVLAVVILTPIMSLGALLLGTHLALALAPFTPSLSLPFVRRWLNPSLVLVAWVSWLGATLMAIWPPDRPGASAARATWAQETWRGEALFALVFAPVGCLLRYYASLQLNAMGRPSFPLGTFAVNMAGTALSGVLFDLQHVPVGDRVDCQVLQGGMDGFCGTLTTVSTWVVELRGLRLRHAYFYGLASVGLGLGFALVIMGSMRWTIGFHSPSCHEQ